MNTTISENIRKLFMDIGLKQGHRNYKKFILLGRSRTGSNLVRGMLNSHGQTIAFGEIFRSIDTLDWGLSGYPSSAATLKLLREDPTGFLDQVVFRKVPREIVAVGFKIFYYHAQQAELKAIWPHLQTQNEIQVLHIKRRNILSTHLSRERAALTDRWANVDGVREKEQPIVLDYEKCLEDFIKTRRWEDEADQFFAGHPIMDVVYEDLVSDFPKAAADIQGFLGLEQRPLKPDTHKQSHQPLSLAIANFAELKEKFSGTPWEGFFSENP